MMKKFIRACSMDELEEKKGFRLILDDYNDIAIFKIDGNIFAVDNVCPHNHTPKIFQGYIEGKNVLCPVHLYKYSLETGRQSEGLGGTLRTYEVRIEGNDVYVEKPKSKLFNFDF